MFSRQAIDEHQTGHLESCEARISKCGIFAEMRPAISKKRAAIHSFLPNYHFIRGSVILVKGFLLDVLSNIMFFANNRDFHRKKVTARNESLS